MNPLLLALLVGGGGYLGYQLLKPKPQTSEGPMGYGSRDLIQGRTYTVQLMVDPTKIYIPNGNGGQRLQGNNPQEVDMTSKVIQAAFEQLGFKVAAPPALFGPEESVKFLQLMPSQWVLTGMWLRPEKNLTTGPDWLLSAVPYQLPIS